MAEGGKGVAQAEPSEEEQPGAEEEERSDQQGGCATGGDRVADPLVPVLEEHRSTEGVGVAQVGDAHEGGGHGSLHDPQVCLADQQGYARGCNEGSHGSPGDDRFGAGGGHGHE